MKKVLKTLEIGKEEQNEDRRFFDSLSLIDPREDLSCK